MSRSYRNEYLFSEIYLESITQQPITDENLRASFQTIKEWREFADKTSLKQWITTYIEPVLDTLGFGHHKNSEELLVLFPDVDKTQPMSLCYVVPPGEDINCTLKGKHWAEKIIRTLRKHNFQWGILTDGVYWRIYHTKKPTPYETYVEINLETILSSQDYAAFQIFYFFFRPDNFVKTENGECKFDIYKEESARTTEYIEENLRAAIEREEVEGVLQTLCLGCLNTLNKDTYSEEDRVCIYRGATLYLFRLLFLFYGASRSLFEQKIGQEFESIVKSAYQLYKEGGVKSDSYNLWFSLQRIFADIEVNYDGGLFDPHNKEDYFRLIEETKITDSFLSKVVFGLAYYKKSKQNFVPIEYRDLSVRHLGSLYEGLLEHNLFIAEENTIIRKSGNKIRFIPESKAGKITRSDTILPKGKVYFSEDAKERKLTGSYYTPEDVVEYIVKNTVDVLLEEKKKDLIKELEPVLKELDSAINESERRRLELFIDDKILKFVEEKILSLSVLDPTMGSGHFLVNATNHIANFIVEILNEYPGCNSEIDSNPGLWRRRVVEDCIYGVDLNPLAVELAKLCLWITTAFKEKPLSFLNHHLKKGNALVGVRISDLEEYLTKARGSKHDLFMQSYINSIKRAAESYEKKLSKLTEAREDIEKKKEILSELDEELAPYKHLCNLFTHYLLGEMNESDFLSQVESWSESKKSQKVLASLNSKDFFHWDLEFPDVFYGDNSGFDVVIGNPPYIEVKKIPNKLKPYLRNKFAYDNIEIMHGRYDIFWAFLVLPKKLMKVMGKAGILTSNSYLDAVSADNLRKFLLTETHLSKIVDYGKFSDVVGVYVVINIFDLMHQSDNYFIKILNGLRDESGITIDRNTILNTDGCVIKYDFEYKKEGFFECIESNSIPLGEILYLQQGIIVQSKSKKRDEFIFNDKINDSLKPYVEGKETDRYFLPIKKHRYINYNPREHHRPRIEEVFTQRKIFIRRISNGIKAMVDEGYFYSDNTLFTGTRYCDLEGVKEKYSRQLHYSKEKSKYSAQFDYYYILGIVNSSLINTYMTLKYGTLSLKVLKKLPIHLILKSASNLPKKEKTEFFTCFPQGIIT